MAFRKKPAGGWRQPAEGQGQQAERAPTFIIKESQKTGQPYATISGRVAPTGRKGAMLMLFPSKFEGTFAGLAINGWGRGMVPVDGDQIDVQGKKVILDLGWLKIEVTGENTAEFEEFLGYVAKMPRVASTFQREEQPPAAAAAETPKKPSWKQR